MARPSDGPTTHNADAEPFTDEAGVKVALDLTRRACPRPRGGRG